MNNYLCLYWLTYKYIYRKYVKQQKEAICFNSMRVDFVHCLCFVFMTVIQCSVAMVKSKLSIQKLDVYMGLYHLHEVKGEKVEDDRQ